MDGEPLPTEAAVAVVATVAGLYVVPPLELQTAPLRCKRRDGKEMMKNMRSVLYRVVHLVVDYILLTRS